MDDENKMVSRETPEDVPEARKALVTTLVDSVKQGKAHFEKEFTRIRKDQEFARGKQWYTSTGQQLGSDNYVANIVQRHIQQRTAVLYAKDPRAVARRKDRIMNTVWDGSMQQVNEAQQGVAMAQQALQEGVPMPPEAIQQVEQLGAILQDYQVVEENNKMLDKVGHTLELLYQYNIDEQIHPFKNQMKAMIRRTLTTGLGWVKLGFQRTMSMRPETEARISDYSERLATLERLTADLADEEFEETDAEAEQLRLMITEMQKESEIIAREGLVFDFPGSSSIIVDPKCSRLNGFIGADWVAHEFILDTEVIQEIYGIDIGKNYTAYEDNTSGAVGASESRVLSMIIDKAGKAISKSKSLACVYEVWSRKDGMVYTVCDGYPDFLKEPAAPDVFIERFWPFFMYATNEVDDETSIYPMSDVSLLRDMQLEINRARQGLREHRKANRPTMAVPTGMLDDTDKEVLRSRPANALIELNALQPGQSVDQVLQAVKMPPIDPALYDVNPLYEDVMHVVGTQEANLGGTSGATATETSIAESSRMSAIGSAADDLDELLTELARSAGQILLAEATEEHVKEIVGPGALWPKLSRAQIIQEIGLSIEAGSTGKPNKAQEMQNLERGMPFLMQMPGLNPEFLAKEIFKRMDDKLDLNEAFSSGMPSIISQNSAKQPGTGDAESDPAQQGGRGGEGGTGATAPQQAPNMGAQVVPQTMQ